MSNVDYQTFLKWAVDRFGHENIRFKGEEICTHSPFTDDFKFHLWMNPSGGKSKHPEFGSFRCWKTDRMGSLVSLVARLDKISFEEAEEAICSISSMRLLEQRVHEFFGSPQDNIIVVEQEPNKGIDFPPDTFKIDDMPSHSSNKRKASNYLRGRKIPTDGFYYCVDGDYKNRIIIPYYDSKGRLVYWNARTISDKPSVIRYMKPEGEGISQDNVLFFNKWPRPGSKVYVTEGEFDATVMDLIERNGCGQGGKSITDSQIQLLRPYIPVLAYDNDEGKKRDSGWEALIENGNKLLAAGFTELYFVRPPKGYKDWNALYEKKSPEVIRAYLDKAEEPYNMWTEEILRMRNLG